MTKKSKNGKKKSAKASPYSVSRSRSPSSALDPRLEAIVRGAEEGSPSDETFVHETADGKQVVDVIVKVADASIEIPKLNVITSVQKILTGTVEVGDLEDVAGHDNVIKLERGKRIFSELHDSVREIRARRSDLQSRLPLGSVPSGQNVIIGVVDFGGDFLHRNLRRNDGSTRIRFLWDQSGAPSPETPSPLPYGYGREMSAAVLDAALAHETPPPSAFDNPFHPEDFQNGAYIHLGYRPNDPDERPAHGTHVMDIAAGNGLGSGFPGVAPDADVIFVQLGSDGGSEASESFGNSVRLLQAVDYIFRKADELGLPAVVNLSLGTHGGPHDGSTPAEQHFDGLLSLPNRVIVISAGNSHQRNIHASGSVSAVEPRTLSWAISNTTRTDNELEVWYSGNDELEATLIDPNGFEIGPFALNDPQQNIVIDGQVVATVTHERDPDNGDNHVDIYFLVKPFTLPFNQGLPTGDWRVRLSTESDAPVAFHSWIERTTPSRQSRFAASDADPSHTVGSISCGQKTIVVGSYNARSVGRTISSFSAEGPTRDGRQKPELSAPGGEFNDGVRAARSLTHTLRTPMAGTSMAAPHVTGVIALMLEITDHPLTIDMIRNTLIAAAGQNSPSPGNVWDSRLGFGRIDALAAVQGTLDAVPPIAVAEATQRTSAALASNGAGSELARIEAELVERITLLAARSRVRVRLNVEVEPT